MTKQEISEHIRIQYPRENEGCDWKEYKNLKNSLCGHEGDDVVSYVSAISNMNGGAIVIGIQDKTFDVVGIQDFGNYTIESAKAKIVEKCGNLPSEELNIDELTASDTGEIVGIVTIPKEKQGGLPFEKLKERNKIEINAERGCWLNNSAEVP